MNIDGMNDQPRLAQARNVVLKRVRRRRHFITAAIAGGAVVVAVSSMGAALTVQEMSTSEARTSVECFAHDDLNSLSGTVAKADSARHERGSTFGPFPASSSSRDNKRDLCGYVWREGLKQAAAHGGHWPDVDPNTSTLPIPPLAFCVLDNGESAGFPIEAPQSTAGEVCDNLGLAIDHSIS
jgi:hypothetical protein